MIFVSPLLLVLGLVQLLAAHKRLRGLSLTGGHRRVGYLTGVALAAVGAFLMPGTLWVLAMVLPATALALVTQAVVGSLAGRHPTVYRFLYPGDWPEGRCQAVCIPGSAHVIPGLLITPPDPTEAAICLVHGSGDNKTAFKWRLIGGLLRRGLRVLTIDLAGHGENQATQCWPDCITEIPIALTWLRSQSGVKYVGLLGISMGGTLSAHAAVTANPDALAICEAPINFQFSRSLVRHEVWNLLRSPILDVLQDITPWQIRRIWNAKRGKREIGLTELIRRLDVPGQVARLSCPLHLVYGERDEIAPPEHGQDLLEVARGSARLTVIPGASHLALILMPETVQILADWFAEQLRSGDR
jgi:pimeloyl-ACP methyl ester carboxylesterase